MGTLAFNELKLISGRCLHYEIDSFSLKRLHNVFGNQFEIIHKDLSPWGHKFSHKPNFI